jgi:hypothetical protein
MTVSCSNRHGFLARHYGRLAWRFSLLERNTRNPKRREMYGDAAMHWGIKALAQLSRMQDAMELACRRQERSA